MDVNECTYLWIERALVIVVLILNGLIRIVSATLYPVILLATGPIRSRDIATWHISGRPRTLRI